MHVTTPDAVRSAALRVGRDRRAAHDEVWFRRTYDANFRAVVGYALRRVTVADDAADVVSETFLVAWRRRTDVPDDPGEARAWLFGAARRVLANHRRGEERRGRLSERLRHELAATARSAGHEDDAAAVHNALGRLSEDDRELITLTSWEQLTPAELAVALGVPAGTVRTRLHRARGRLAELLAEPANACARAGHLQQQPAEEGSGT